MDGASGRGKNHINMAHCGRDFMLPLIRDHAHAYRSNLGPIALQAPDSDVTQIPFPPGSPFAKIRPSAETELH